MSAHPEPQPEKPSERYGDSYLAMEATRRSPAAGKPVRRHSGKWIKEFLLLILIVGVVAYVQRGRLVLWLEQNPRTVPLAQVIREQWGPKRETKKLAGAVAEPLPAGGETTFSSGQGFGTVVPDDGSDAFRVVVPPERENAR